MIYQRQFWLPLIRKQKDFEKVKQRVEIIETIIRFTEKYKIVLKKKENG